MSSWKIVEMELKMTDWCPFSPSGYAQEMKAAIMSESTPQRCQWVVRSIGLMVSSIEASGMRPSGM
jgi:hypothetical protein